jgi:hypothetical protein
MSLETEKNRVFGVCNKPRVQRAFLDLIAALEAEDLILGSVEVQVPPRSRPSVEVGALMGVKIMLGERR